MKKLIAGFVAFWIISTSFAQNRIVNQFNDSWKFCQCDASSYSTSGFNDASWTTVSTPHTWNAMDGQDGGNNYVRGIGWYRKHFTISNTVAGKRVFVKFNASNMTTDVYVNGNSVGSHTGGYSAFAFDITDKVILGGSNVIAVKVNNSDTIKAPPLDADFTFYGGITKSVELIYTDPVHITLLDYGSPGVYITQSNVSSSNADLILNALVKNDGLSSANVTVTYTILDASGSLVQSANSSATLAAGGQSALTTTTTITNPTLWNGLTNPYLYHVKAQVYVSGVLLDEVIQPLGIRYFSVDVNNGFFLNGLPYRLHGVAHHEDRLDKGRAISDQDRMEDLGILKDLGCNYLRLAHYQHGQYTYNYCDSVGIAVWAEMPMVDKIDGSLAFADNAKQQLIELIRQNYNHPSVIVWALSNEVTYKTGPDPSPLVQQLNTLAKTEDNSRLTASAAMNTSAGLNFYSDVYSCNVYNGWYYNTYNDFATWATNQHSTYPSNPFGVSEYGAGANVTQHEPLNPLEPINYGPWHPEEYQALFHEAHWQAIQARPYLWSTSVWVGFDFSSDGRNEGLQPGINDKGLVTRDRKVKKDAYYYYKANWNPQPMVYITSRRFNVRYDSVLTAKVYSNCDSVKLKVNNTFLSSKTSTNTIYNWAKVTLTRGINQIVAIGYKNHVAYYDTCYWQFNGPYVISVLPGDIQINFEAATTVTPAGYLKDYGSIYGDRGNGHTYGWDANITTNGRERNVDPIKTYDTFIHMQLNNGYNYWEIELPTGYYRVSIVVGEPNYFDSFNAITAEGQLMVYDPVYSSKRHGFGTDTIYVSDGRLTIRPATGSGATNTKIDFIHITPVTINNNTTAVVTPFDKTSMLVFPNPSSSELTISNIKEEVVINVNDIRGNNVLNYTKVQPGSFTFSTENLREGIYVVEISSENSKSYEKVIVE